MRVVVIGSGNVATVLGRRMKAMGHEPLQVVSRNLDHARVLANELNCEATGPYGQVNKSADLYLIAVNDNALLEINKQFHLGRLLVVHTAGSMSMDVLQSVSSNFGVLYPLQSLFKNMEPDTDIPFLVEGNSPETQTIIADFAGTLSGKVANATDEERLKLHVAAVVVNNFTNHLYALVEEFCRKENVDFNLLVPLIQETAQRLATHSPSSMQTGPAIRNDLVTVEKHLRLLARFPVLKSLYLKFTDSIMNRQT